MEKQQSLVDREKNMEQTARETQRYQERGGGEKKYIIGPTMTIGLGLAQLERQCLCAPPHTFAFSTNPRLQAQPRELT